MKVMCTRANMKLMCTRANKMVMNLIFTTANEILMFNRAIRW